MRHVVFACWFAFAAASCLHVGRLRLSSASSATPMTWDCMSAQRCVCMLLFTCGSASCLRLGVVRLSSASLQLALRLAIVLQWFVYNG